MSQGQSPEKRTFDVRDEGRRLDKYLADSCPDITRSHIQKLIQNGHVTVNNRIERPSCRLRSGDHIEILIPPPDSSVLVPEDIPFDVIYEDQDIVIINKPAGLTVYPAP